MDTIEIGDLPTIQETSPLRSSPPSHSRHVDLEVELLAIPLTEFGVGLQTRSFVCLRRVISIAGLSGGRLSAALASADDLGAELSATAVVDAILQADNRVAHATEQPIGGLNCAVLRLLPHGQCEWATFGNAEVSVLQGEHMVVVAPESTIRDIAAGITLLTSALCLRDKGEALAIGPKVLAHLISDDNNFSALAMQAASDSGNGSLIVARKIVGAA